MNKRPNNPAQVNEAGESSEMNNELQPETLIELAREYFAADFPNPDRRDCPDSATLRSLAQSGHLPDDTLRAHLFGCSECFQEYRTALARRPVAAGHWWTDWRGKLRALRLSNPGLAWAGAALVLLAVSWLAWTRWRGGNANETLTMAEKPAAPPTAQLAQQRAPLAAPRHSPTAQQRAVTPEAVTTVRVDLNQYLALRGATAASGSRQVIRLAPVRTRLRLRLPEGSLAGAYTVSLIDEFDQPLVTAKAVSRDGKSLQVTLDLRRGKANSLRLRVQHQAEPADFYLVELVSAGKGKKTMTSGGKGSLLKANSDGRSAD